MTYGKIVQACRKARGLTLEQVAKRIESHKGYVSGIENGKVNPPAPTITCRLAGMFGLDPEDLLELAWAEKAPKRIKERALRRISDNKLLQMTFTPSSVSVPV